MSENESINRHVDGTLPAKALAGAFRVWLPQLHEWLNNNPADVEDIAVVNDRDTNTWIALIEIPSGTDLIGWRGVGSDVWAALLDLNKNIGETPPQVL